jgi:hypothetical protein
MAAREPKSNVQGICPCCAEKRRVDLTGVDPRSLLGFYVKRMFSQEVEVDGQTVERREHMWVFVEGVSGDRSELLGRLDNQPIGLSNVKLHDKVRVSLAEVEEIIDPKQPPGVAN